VVPLSSDIVVAQGGYTDAFKSNHNPSLYVCFYRDDTAGPADGSTHKLCQIYYTDILRGKFQLRHVQLRGPSKKHSSNFASLFKGAAPTTFLANNYHLLHQLLMEVRGDWCLTQLFILEFQKGYATTELDRLILPWNTPSLVSSAIHFIQEYQQDDSR
jgi:hypothetical protein